MCGSYYILDMVSKRRNFTQVSQHEMPALLEALSLTLSWLSALNSVWTCPANELGDVGGFICPRECQHLCHRKDVTTTGRCMARTDTLLVTSYETVGHCPPWNTNLLLGPNCVNKQKQLWELVFETRGLYFGSLGVPVSKGLVSIA